MVCPDFQYDPYGRSGLGLSQGQSGLNYPFVLPSEDIRYLLADFFLAFEDEGDYDPAVPKFSGPYTIAWMYGLGCLETAAPDWTPTPTHDVDLIVKDSTGAIVFDSTTVEDFTSFDWGPAWRIYEWFSTTAICRLVVHTKWNPETTQPLPRNYDEHILPENGLLNDRAVVKLPKRVRSLSAVLDTISRQATDLVAGYNVRIDVEQVPFRSGGRSETRLVFNAIPGEGQGRYDDCGVAVDYIRRINGVSPTSTGEFLFVAKDCMFTRTPMEQTSVDPVRFRPQYETDPLAPHLLLGNDCGRCCECDDFVQLANDIHTERDLYQDIGDSVSQARELYIQNRETWIKKTKCYRTPLRLTLVAQTGAYIDVVGQYINQTDQCLRDLALTFACTSDPEATPDPKTVKYATLRDTSIPKKKNQQYTMDGTWGEFKAYWDSVKPGDTVRVRFRLQFPNNGVAADSVPYALTVALSAALGNYDPAGPLTKSATLNSV